QAALFDRDFVVGTSEGGIIFADIDRDAAGLRLPAALAGTSSGIEIQFLRLPRFSVFGIKLWIGGRLECFRSDDTRGLMVSVTVAWSSREAGNDNFRPELTDDANIVSDEFVVSPFLERLGRRLRKPEFVHGREELLGMIETPGRQKFFRPDDAELLEQFRAQQV